MFFDRWCTLLNYRRSPILGILRKLNRGIATHTLWQHPNRTWYVVVYWRDTKRSTRHSLGETDRYAAEEAYSYWLRSEWPRILARRRDDKEIPKAEHTLHAMLTWYRERDLPLAGIKPKSVKKYLGIVEPFVTYCESRGIRYLEQLTSTVIQDYQIERGFNPSTRRDHLLALRRWIEGYSRMSRTFCVPIRRK